MNDISKDNLPKDGSGCGWWLLGGCCL